VTTIPIKPDELLLWSRYIKEISGINLDSSKGYLLETRLGGLLRETSVDNFADFYNKAKTDFTGALRRKILDAITTNETSFFRDTSPFDLLQNKIIPELIDRKNKVGMRPVPIRIWSAASSTGQEAYSTGIVLKELLGDFRNYDVRILGTDISDRAVAAASYGHFSKLELERGLAPEKLSRYFTQSGDKWKIRDEIRAMATFRTMNLLEPFSFPVPFDIIFCRNVAIYFTEPDKQRLFRNLGKFLAKDGALIIGSTESLSGLCPEYEPKRYLRTVFYQIKSVG
jgi:chemotaxis protein methyltransferase CheR